MFFPQPSVIRHGSQWVSGVERFVSGVGFVSSVGIKDAGKRRHIFCPLGCSRVRVILCFAIQIRECIVEDRRGFKFVETAELKILCQQERRLSLAHFTIKKGLESNDYLYRSDRCSTG